MQRLCDDSATPPGLQAMMNTVSSCISSLGLIALGTWR